MRYTVDMENEVIAISNGQTVHLAYKRFKGIALCGAWLHGYDANTNKGAACTKCAALRPDALVAGTAQPARNERWNTAGSRERYMQVRP